ncbi:LytTR family DNA-binding domain-containing protein [Spirosoma migulaei]
MIIEDEPLAQDLLIDHVERIPGLELIGTAINGQQALAKCKALKPDLLLLDIRMPRLSGFEILDLLPKPVPLVVVTTAYREYALKGYEHAVVDFLEKPIYFDRFSQAIQRVKERLGFVHRGTENVDSEEHEEVALYKTRLSVRVDRQQVNIPLENINFIEALDNYVKIHLITQPAKPLLSKVTVSQLENKLPNQHFLRINRKYIVHVDQIYRFTSTYVQLFTGQELAIGVTFRDSVRHVLDERSAGKGI